jgi:hypothetical protein
MVAGWYIRIPKIPIWIYFGIFWYILGTLKLIVWEYLMAIRKILRQFGIFDGRLVYSAAVWI